jgi:hypothetical protein
VSPSAAWFAPHTKGDQFPTGSAADPHTHPSAVETPGALIKYSADVEAQYVVSGTAKTVWLLAPTSVGINIASFPGRTVYTLVKQKMDSIYLAKCDSLRSFVDGDECTNTFFAIGIIWERL